MAAGLWIWKLCLEEEQKVWPNALAAGRRNRADMASNKLFRIVPFRRRRLGVVETVDSRDAEVPIVGCVGGEVALVVDVYF